MMYHFQTKISQQDFEDSLKKVFPNYSSLNIPPIYSQNHSIKAYTFPSLDNLRIEVSYFDNLAVTLSGDHPESVISKLSEINDDDITIDFKLA